jgi:hypothetical protein
MPQSVVTIVTGRSGVASSLKSRNSSFFLDLLLLGFEHIFYGIGKSNNDL